VRGERAPEAFGLARGRRQRRVDRLDRRAWLDQQIELPLFGVALAERIHFRKFLAGIDVHHRAGHVAEEGLARKPDHHVGVFSKRPQDGDALEACERFAKDKNALRFQLVQAVRLRRLDRACRRSRAAGNSGLFFAIDTHFFFHANIPN
jgi:hypothetical protein